MRRLAAAPAAMLVVVSWAACGSGGILRQYEYEEDTYLGLDGAATVYVNASLAALDALRGTSFDIRPGARLDRSQVRAFFASPGLRVDAITGFRRSGRQFVHVKLTVPDILQLQHTAPFAWSTYQFGRQGDQYVFKQTVAGSADRDVGTVGWTGRELVAFRLHLPSKITFHNAPPGNLKRGNILVWEQPLDARRRGEPLVLDARTETQSILYRTLLLFGATFLVVAAVFAILLWTILHRKGR
jgi:hypothetical protein